VLLIRHRDRVTIPIPRYAEMKKAWQAEHPADFAEQERQIEVELTQQIQRLSRRKKVALLAQIGAHALSQCEYLRANVAGRLAIGLNNRNVDGVLVYLVSSAGLALWGNFNQNFDFVRGQTCLATPSTNWGCAWALFLAGDWGRAEGLLLRALDKAPTNTTILAMLAVTQAQRNKYQSAVIHSKRAADLEPDDLELSKLAVRFLLDSGRLGEAASRLCAIESHAASDAEIAVMRVRLHVLRRDHKEAHAAVDVVRQADNSPIRLIHLGGVFETARQDESAAQFYREALTAGHYPEALLGLARLATNEERFHEAKSHLEGALNLETETASKGRTAVELFQSLVAQLSLLSEPRSGCKAWIVTFPKDVQPAALADRSLMVYSTTRFAAETHLDFVLRAMQPTGNPVAASKLQWREAPADNQPARPVREGIQFVM
jgi:tetratricopeptide (TPR) repeat protein